MSNKANGCLTRALISLIQMPNNAFVTTLAFSIPINWDKSILTACVNSKEMKINPDFFLSLKKDERVTLLAHEVWHIAFAHLDRLGDLDPQRFNSAADYVINEVLVSQGFTPIPGWLYDKKYHGMTTKQVYDLLESDEQQGKPKASDGNSLDGDIEPVQGVGTEAEIEEENLKEMVIRANTAELLEATAKELANDSDNQAAGTLPGQVQALIEGYLNPVLPWEVILQNYMSEYDKSDYSWKRPNKRYMPDMILPSLYSESMAEIALAFDTSCSVSDEELKRYVTEVDYIIKRLEPKRVTVASFDTKVQRIDVLDKGDPISKVKLVGRGGTDLFPVFKHYNKPKNKPTVLLVFSDLYCTPIPEDQEPDYDVIWICVGNKNATTHFGKTIHIEVEDLLNG